MKQGFFIRSFPAVVLLAAVLAVPVHAQEADDGQDQPQAREFRTEISGYEEVPTLFSPASGDFGATVNEDATEIEYQLSYAGFTTPVQQAHVHLGREGVNGGVIAFLCSNLPNPPANVPACPEMEGDVGGTLTQASVVGPEDQGISLGEFDKLIDALNNDAVYANVHTEQHPDGELRGQLTTEGEGGTTDLLE